MTRRFVVCIHDANPAYARETRTMIAELAPLLGRRFSFAVVPNWYGEWPLTAHPGYCRLIRDSADELLLHGYRHQRERGSGPVTWLTEGGDELNGLDPHETRRTLDRAQRAFADAFGEPARGFVGPSWQLGNLRLNDGRAAGLEYIMGFFSLESAARARVPLATWTWDCGRWGWLGHVGHGIGWLSQSIHRGVPVLAIHPRDVTRGFWPRVLQLTLQLRDRGYEPITPARLLDVENDL